MTSWVSLANRALARIGDGGITSLTDLESPAAIKINEIYQDVLDEVLALHPWNCALERSTLAQDSATPSFGFDYSYALPVDPWCLRVWRVENLTDDWQVLGRHLYTNAGAPLYAEWIRRVTDPNELSPWVKTAFIWKLAAELAYWRTGSGALADRLDEKFEKIILPQARGQDGGEGTAEDFEVADFIESRL